LWPFAKDKVKDPNKMTLISKLIPSSGAFRVAVIAVLLFSFCSGFCQNRQITVSSLYNIPIGELSWSYKAGTGVQLGYSFIHEKRRGPSRITGVYLGYTVLQPIADTLYFVVDNGGQAASGSGAGLGMAMYSPFKMFQLGGKVAWRIYLSEKLCLTPGFGVGIFYGKRDVMVKDSFGAEDGLQESVGWGVLTPEAGVEYLFSDHVGAKLFVAYNFMIQSGDTNVNSINYNENAGKFCHYYSPGLSLNFTF
jgi:hypothetical protein